MLQKELFYTICDYRFMGSPRKYFEGQTSLTSTAYQCPRCKPGQKWIDVANKMTDCIVNLIPNVLFTKSWSITETVDFLIHTTTQYNENGFEYVFHLNEIAKDLSLIYPTHVDLNSECYVGKGAVIGLMAIEGKATKCPTNTIKGKNLRRKHKEIAKKIYDNQIDNWNFSCMEHALCEYGKYEKIRLFGGGRKYKKG